MEVFFSCSNFISTAATGVISRLFSFEDLLRGGIAFFFAGRDLGNIVESFVIPRYGQALGALTNRVLRYGTALASTQFGNTFQTIGRIFARRIFNLDTLGFYPQVQIHNLLKLPAAIMNTLSILFAQKFTEITEYFPAARLDYVAAPILAVFNYTILNFMGNSECLAQMENNYGIDSYMQGLNATCLNY